MFSLVLNFLDQELLYIFINKNYIYRVDFPTSDIMFTPSVLTVISARSTQQKGRKEVIHTYTLFSLNICQPLYFSLKNYTRKICSCPASWLICYEFFSRHLVLLVLHNNALTVFALRNLILPTKLYCWFVL